MIINRFQIDDAIFVDKKKGYPLYFSPCLTFSAGLVNKYQGRYNSAHPEIVSFGPCLRSLIFLNSRNPDNIGTSVVEKSLRP